MGTAFYVVADTIIFIHSCTYLGAMHVAWTAVLKLCTAGHEQE